jgi:Xaa-Pro aminopeptidase
MRKNNVDVMLATSPDNIYYTSHSRVLEPFTTACAVIYPVDEEPVLLVPKPEEGFIEDSIVKDKRFYGDFFIVRPVEVKSVARDFVTSISSILEEKKLDKNTIGFEEKYMAYMFVEGLKHELPNAKFMGASAIFEEARTIKSEEEKRKIKDAVRIWEGCLIDAYRSVQESQTELEFSKNLKTSITGKGADLVFNEMGAGKRSGFPTHPSQYKMQRGDLIHVDFGITYHGYSCDMSRNAVIGKPTQEYLNINNALEAGHEEAQRLLKPGVKLSEIFNSTVKAIRENGIPNYKRHHIGHGIGIPPHEPPGINSTNDMKLEQDMTLCVETPYYVSTLGGFNLENVVLISKDGCEVISQLSQDLFELPI